MPSVVDKVWLKIYLMQGFLNQFNFSPSFFQFCMNYGSFHTKGQIVWMDKSSSGKIGQRKFQTQVCRFCLPFCPSFFFFVVSILPRQTSCQKTDLNSCQIKKWLMSCLSRKKNGHFKIGPCLKMIKSNSGFTEQVCTVHSFQSRHYWDQIELSNLDSQRK